MSLFGFMFGYEVSVDSRGIVTVTGIRYRDFQRFIQKFYNSGTFLERFTRRTWANSIQIHQFYVPELIYLLTKAVEEKYLPPLQVKRVIEKLYEKTWFASSTWDVQSPVDMDAIKNSFQPELVLKDYQEEFIKNIYFQKKTQYRLNGYLLSLSQGLGKGLVKSTPVRVPSHNGCGEWKRIGDLKVGDQVIAIDGTPANVIGVYPQGMEDLYKVTFRDGRYLITDAAHRWTILTQDKRKDPNEKLTCGLKETVVSTEDLYTKYVKNNQWSRVFIPMITPEDCPDIDLPIHPYTLGVILGDGCISGLRTIKVTTDLDIVHRIEAIDNSPFTISICKDRRMAPYCCDASFYPLVRGIFPLREALINFGLMGKCSLNKFIPSIYFKGSYNQRLELLRGLLDTDGYVSDKFTRKGRNGTPVKCGSIEYSTSSEMLAYGVRELVLSLGGQCNISSRIPHYTYKGERLEGERNWRLLIQFKHPDEVFTLERKKRRLAHEHQYSKYWKLHIESVEKLDYQDECVCIKIDHPSELFVAKDYIVTHNTLTSLALGTALHKLHAVIICPLSTVRNVWESEINRWFKNKQTIWTPDKDPLLINKDTDYVIVNYEAIPKIKDAVLKYFTPKDTIFIVDECHNFKDVKSLRSKNLFELVSTFQSEDTLLMSGTPIKAIGNECIPIFKILDTMFTPDVEEDLLKLFRFTKVMNDLFRNRLGLMMYRVLKEDVLQLPEKHEAELRIKIPNGDYYTLENVKKLVIEFSEERRHFYEEHYNEYMDVYKACLKEFELTLQSREDWEAYKLYLKDIALIQKNGYGFDNIEVVKAANKYEKEVIIPHLPTRMRTEFRASKSVVKYVELKILGEVLGGLLNDLRTEMTTELIGDEVMNIIKDSIKKTILFSSYTESIRIAERVCKAEGLHPLCITGDNTKQAAQLLSVFKADLTMNPLIASIKAMSTGHTIIEANTVIFLNVPFRSVDYEQASDRVYRIGQDTDVYIYKLVLDTGSQPNLSTRMQDIIAWSKESFDAIIGDDIDDPAAMGIIPKDTVHAIVKYFKDYTSPVTDDRSRYNFTDLVDKAISILRRFLK